MHESMYASCQLTVHLEAESACTSAIYITSRELAPCCVSVYVCVYTHVATYSVHVCARCE